MSNYVVAGKKAELRKGQMKAVSIAGQEILLANTERGIYAATNICPHMKGRLNKGTLKGTIVTCPKHASRFDLRDGHVVRWTNWSGVMRTIGKVFRSPRPLKTYRTEVKGDRIMVELG
jgi:3-phenylpropionate/trans-cinnamate dioxygenase ferredoxin subunit